MVHLSHMTGETAVLQTAEVTDRIVTEGVFHHCFSFLQFSISNSLFLLGHRVSAVIPVVDLVVVDRPHVLVLVPVRKENHLAAGQQAMSKRFQSAVAAARNAVPS